MGDYLVNRIKKIVLFPALFYLGVYIPLIFIVYLPYWYKLNCNWHPRCEEIGYEKTVNGINDLTSFFLHKGDLTTFLTKKEKLHLAEVRDLFDKMFVMFFVSLILLILTFERRRVAKYALINIGIILSFLVILPFFATFWRDIFHPILFHNELWKNNRFDLSYYLMPRQFFKYTIVLLIASSCILNFLIWFAFRRRNV
ncbi:DUF1461 domain-containing protein [Desulfobacterota bacterium AH_259_B03_O07]|nr:DUF1461 domain-containing protein [Desulfobacterota bacterium AH_259_B03_O07]